MSDDRRVVQCNLTEATKITPNGARAYVTLSNPGNGHDRIMILVRSHGGRWVSKWENLNRLDNFRVKTIPLGHPLYEDRRLYDYEPEALAEVLTQAKRHQESWRPA